MVSKLKLQYWRQLALLAIATSEMAFILGTALPVRHAAAYPVTQVLNTSSSPTLQTRWYTLRGYGHLNRFTDTYWPQRSNGCGGGGFKISPWQPEYQFTYSGNDINQSSNCADRYSDAGTTANGGAWMQPYGDGTWSKGYQTIGWNNGAPSSFSSVMGGCSTLTGGGARGIWGSPSPDTTDQFYTAGNMGSMGGVVPGLYRDLYPTGTQQSLNLYSNGVTLVRDHFDLTAAALAQLQQSGTQFLFQAYADDWLQVYINGVPAASSQHTTNGVTLNLATVKGALNVGTNWVGIMVADKAIFATRDPGDRGAGVCYNMQYEYDQPPPYDLQPLINTTITENGSVVSGNVAQVGDTITFNYAVQNTNWGASDNVNCTVYGDSFAGYHSIPAPPDKGTVQPVGTGCPRSFPGNSTTDVGSQTFVANTVNQTICRSLYVNPATNGGGERGTEVCILVAARPYVKVFGADVSVGNSFGTSCVPDNTAGIAAWNRESGGSYAGAGTQFAAQTLANILDFASAQNTAGAAAPYGLSFANTNRSASIFGGQFGSLGKCLPDYYAGKPATAVNKTAAELASLSSLGSGVFQETGDVALSGNINSGQNTVIYIKGNVYINGPITYPGVWSYDKIPLLEIVTQGNIYINSGVTQLAGTFIAQPSGGAGGAIYTCTTGSAPLSLSGAMYNTCNNQLIINGQFMANQVYLLRTKNSLNNASAGETNTSSSGAEVFNFTPANWITQPPQGSNTNTSTVDSYDSVSALPPVL